MLFHVRYSGNDVHFCGCRFRRGLVGVSTRPVSADVDVPGTWPTDRRRRRAGADVAGGRRLDAAVGGHVQPRGDGVCPAGRTVDAGQRLAETGCD